jgi:hypothetical protein
MRHNTKPQPRLPLFERARNGIAQSWREYRNAHMSESERRLDLAKMFAANAEHITFVFEDRSHPIYLRRDYRVVTTPTINEFLEWEASGLRDGTFVSVRPTRLSDWQLGGQMRAAPMSDLGLRWGH